MILRRQLIRLQGMMGGQLEDVEMEDLGRPSVSPSGFQVDQAPVAGPSRLSELIEEEVSKSPSQKHQ